MDIELAQTAIRRCLNEAIARGATTIAFPSYFPAFTPIISIEFVMKVISNWMYEMDQKKMLGKLREIQILCHSPTIYRIYRGMIRKLIYDLYDSLNATGSAGLFDVFSVVLRSNRFVILLMCSLCVQEAQASGLRAVSFIDQCLSIRLRPEWPESTSSTSYPQLSRPVWARRACQCPAGVVGEAAAKCVDFGRQGRVETPVPIDQQKQRRTQTVFPMLLLRHFNQEDWWVGVDKSVYVCV